MWWYGSFWRRSNLQPGLIWNVQQWRALILLAISTGSQGQFPITQNVTVVEGTSANMTCRVDYNDNTSLQWSNPAQQTLFFGDKKGEHCSPGCGCGCGGDHPLKHTHTHNLDIIDHVWTQLCCCTTREPEQNQFCSRSTLLFTTDWCQWIVRWWKLINILAGLHLWARLGVAERETMMLRPCEI